MYASIFDKFWWYKARNRFSRAKNCQQQFAVVHFYVAPLKRIKMPQNKCPKHKNEQEIEHRKMQCRELSEMRFAKVSWPYRPCLRGKQLFKVYRSLALVELNRRIQHRNHHMLDNCVLRSLCWIW